MDSNYACLAVISIHSVLNKDRNYYLQVFSKECKYIMKKVIRHIIDDIEILLMILMKNRLTLSG